MLARSDFYDIRIAETEYFCEGVFKPLSAAISPMGWSSVDTRKLFPMLQRHFSASLQHSSKDIRPRWVPVGVYLCGHCLLPQFHVRKVHILPPDSRFSGQDPSGRTNNLNRRPLLRHHRRKSYGRDEGAKVCQRIRPPMSDLGRNRT